MTVARVRTLRAALATAGIVALAACSSPPVQEGTVASDTDRVDVAESSSNQSDARAAWDEADALAEATQAKVAGDWSASDSAAEPCGTGGVRWGATRIGPGTSGSDRADVVAAISALWTERGYDAAEEVTSGDAPGVRLRHPSADSLQNGFFIEFRTTTHASTLQLQTPCTPGDAAALNAERYAERHTKTPPDVPGATASSTPSAGAGS